MKLVIYRVTESSARAYASYHFTKSGSLKADFNELNMDECLKLATALVIAAEEKAKG